MDDVVELVMDIGDVCCGIVVGVECDDCVDDLVDFGIDFEVVGVGC